MLTEEDEDRIYDAQDKWIKEHCGEEALATANTGWSTDDVTDTVCTKVYGHGILCTNKDLKHSWEEF